METIFIIDDRPINRKVLKRLAHTAQSDADIRTFADPRAAIEAAAQHPPDLVVTDFEMPKMNGAEFIRHFRAMPMCYDVPVIVITAYDNKESGYSALKLGATDFMFSPIDYQKFQARIRTFMRMRVQQKIDTPKYAFEGSLIRLNRADYEQWELQFSAIPDLRASLQRLDKFYDRQLEGGERKSWFSRVFDALKNEHEKHLNGGRSPV